MCIRDRREREVWRRGGRDYNRGGYSSSQLSEIDPMSPAGAVDLSLKEKEGPLRLDTTERE